ncbi:hypothetical protein [Halomonas sp. A3H3]|uniref:hypothetical protein n=1 Tax=Halomonas sp. A3H3 TaxID=1346287 RepID=UPI00130E4719|nr:MULTISPECIES: hypothetical protein [unclassified Halomonas]
MTLGVVFARSQPVTRPPGAATLSDVCRAQLKGAQALARRRSRPRALEGII